MRSPIPAAAYLVCVIVCVTLAAAALSRWVRADALDRALVAGVSGIVIPVGAALVLGMANLLSTWGFLATLVAIATAATVSLARSPTPVDRVPAAWSLAGMASLVSAGAFGFLALAPTIAGRPTEEYDSRNYHIVNLATWFREHSIWPLPFQNPGYFTATHPGNGEMLGMAMLLATQGDHIVYMTNLVFAAVTVIACATIARELDGRPDLAALACIALLGTPLIFGTQAHSLMTDLAATVGIAAGTAALLRARRSRDVRWIVVAGFALGFSLGAKYSVLLLVPIVVGIAVLALRPRRNALWLAPGLVLMGAPWFIRNLVETGNPVFPQAVRIGGVELFTGGESPLTQYSTTILGHVFSGNWGVLASAARIGWDLTGPAALLVGAGLVAAFIRPPLRVDRMVVTGIAAAAALTYAITPYSGGGDQGAPFLIASSFRYAIPAAFLAAAVAVVVAPGRLVLGLSAAMFGFDVWHMARGYGWRSDLDLRTPLVVLVVLALAIGATAAMVALGELRVNFRPYAWAPAGAIACLVLAFGLWQIGGTPGSTRLERVLASMDGNDVVVLGVHDVRGALGSRLQARLHRVTGTGPNGESPPRSRAQLDAAVASSGGDVLVVQDETPGVPKGYTPPDEWQLAATTPDGDVYVRSPEDTPAPPATPAPPKAPPAPAS